MDTARFRLRTLNDQLLIRPPLMDNNDSQYNEMTDITRCLIKQIKDSIMQAGGIKRIIGNSVRTLIFVLAALGSISAGAQINVFQPGQPIRAAEINQNFGELSDQIDTLRQEEICRVNLLAGALWRGLVGFGASGDELVIVNFSSPTTYSMTYNQNIDGVNTRNTDEGTYSFDPVSCSLSMLGQTRGAFLVVGASGKALSGSLRRNDSRLGGSYASSITLLRGFPPSDSRQVQSSGVVDESGSLEEQLDAYLRSYQTTQKLKPETTGSN